MAQANAAAGPAAPASPRPWTQRWVDAAPVAPIWVGIAIAAAHALSSVVYFALFGSPQWSLSTGVFWRHVFPPVCIMGSLMGFSVAGMAYSRRAQLSILERLRPNLDCSPAEFAELVHAVEAFDLRRLRRVALPLALVIPVLITFDPMAFPWLGHGFTLESLDMMVWGLWNNGITIWLGVYAGLTEQRAARLFSQIGREHARVDVLDLTPLEPFAHRGLQSVLLYVIFLSLFSLIFVGGWAVTLAPAGVVVMLPVAVLALFLPLRGVHQSIREAKRARLETLRSEIRRDEADVMDRDSPHCAAAAARLPALLAVRDRVEAAREWPLDLSNWLRFGLYLAIGLGSWIGGALAERALDLALS